MENGIILNSFENSVLRQKNLMNFEPFSSGKTAVQLLDESKANYLKPNSQLNNSQTVHKQLKSIEEKSTECRTVNSSPIDDRLLQCVDSKVKNLPVQCVDVNRVSSDEVSSAVKDESLSERRCYKSRDKSDLTITLNNNNNDNLKDLNRLNVQHQEQTTKLLNSLLNTSESNRPLTSIILSNKLNKTLNNQSNQFSIRTSSPNQHKRKQMNHQHRSSRTKKQDEQIDLETQLYKLICIDHDDTHLPTFSSSSTSEGPSSNYSRPSSICSSPISPSLFNTTKASSSAHPKTTNRILGLNASDDVRHAKKAKSILSTSIPSILTVSSKAKLPSLPSLATLSKTSKAILSSKFTFKVCSKVNSKSSCFKTSKSCSPTTGRSTDEEECYVDDRYVKSDDAGNDLKSDTRNSLENDASNRSNDVQIDLKNDQAKNGLENTVKCTINRDAECNAIIQNQLNHLNSPSNKTLSHDTASTQPVSTIEKQLPSSTAKLRTNEMHSRSLVELLVSISKCTVNEVTTNQSKNGNQINDFCNELQSDFRGDLRREQIEVSNVEGKCCLSDECSNGELKRLEYRVSSDHEPKSGPKVMIANLDAVSKMRNLNKSLSLGTNLNNLDDDLNDRKAHSYVLNRSNSQINKRTLYDTKPQSTDRVKNEINRARLSKESKDNMVNSDQRLNGTTGKLNESTELNVVTKLNKLNNTPEQAGELSTSAELNRQLAKQRNVPVDFDELINLKETKVSRSKSDIGHRVDRATIQNRFKSDMQRVFNTIGLDMARTVQQVNSTATNYHYNFNVHNPFVNQFSDSNLYIYTPPLYQTATVNRLPKNTSTNNFNCTQLQYLNCNQSTVDSYYTLDSSPKLAFGDLINKTDYRMLDQMNDQRIENQMMRLDGVIDENVMRIDHMMDKNEFEMIDKIDFIPEYKNEHNDYYLDTMNRTQSMKADHSPIYSLNNNANKDLKTNQFAGLTKSAHSIQLNTNLIANLDPTLSISFNSVSLPTNKPNLSKFIKSNTLKHNLNAAKLPIPEHDLDTGEISIIERNARVIKWLYNCKKYYENAI